VILRLKMEAG